MNKLFLFLAKKPLILFLSVYSSGLILNRIGLLINPLASTFLGKTWMLIFLALTLPVIGFSLAAYLFNKVSHESSSFIKRKISFSKLKLFHFFSFLASVIVLLVAVITALNAGGIFLLNPDKAKDIHDTLSGYNEAGKSLNSIPFSSTILTFGRCLPVLIATTQHFISLSNISKKNIKFFTLLTVLSLINLVISSLILGARIILAYPLLLYVFTSAVFSLITLKNNKIKKENQAFTIRRRNTKLTLNQIFNYLIVISAFLVAILIIVQIGSFRGSSTQGYSLASQIAGGNPLFGSLVELYLYYSFGFDVLNARVQLSDSTIEQFSPECYWSVILPGFHKLIELFGEAQSGLANCNLERFNIYGYTNSTYLSFLPVDNILIFVSVILALGLIWGWSYIYYKKSLFAFLVFIFISVGMFFASFTNLIVRDFVITGIVFLYPLLYLLLLPSRSKSKQLITNSKFDHI